MIIAKHIHESRIDNDQSFDEKSNKTNATIFSRVVLLTFPLSVVCFSCARAIFDLKRHDASFFNDYFGIETLIGLEDEDRASKSSDHTRRHKLDTFLHKS